jgi:hypothetical protein
MMDIMKLTDKPNVYHVETNVPLVDLMLITVILVTPLETKTHHHAHVSMENMKMKTTNANLVTTNVLFVPDHQIIVMKEAALIPTELMTMFVPVSMVTMMLVLLLVPHA